MVHLEMLERVLWSRVDWSGLLLDLTWQAFLCWIGLERNALCLFDAARGRFLHFDLSSVSCEEIGLLQSLVFRIVVDLWGLQVPTSYHLPFVLDVGHLELREVVQDSLIVLRILLSGLISRCR